MSLKKVEREMIIKALENFESAAEKPDAMCGNVIMACAEYESVFRKHEPQLGKIVRRRFKTRAEKALHKALGA